MNYCESYQISFSKEDVERYIPPAELWQKHFGNDPMWSSNFDINKD